MPLYLQENIGVLYMPINNQTQYSETRRYFGSQQALQPHLDSLAHNFECDECDRSGKRRKEILASRLPAR